MNTNQTLTSEWGRKPLTVASDVPTVALRFRLGRTHVGTCDLEVARDVWQAIRQANSHGTVPLYSRRARRETLAAALWIHHEQRAAYACVMSGAL